MKNYRKLLVTRSTPELAPLRALVEEQTHLALVLWALDCAAPTLSLFEKYAPHDPRPRQALQAAEAWARGSIKMPVAKKAAHAAHHAATEAAANPIACSAARAMGHVVGTVHVETHALGLVFYGITAKIYEEGIEYTQNILQQELAWYYNRLLFWQQEAPRQKGPWAGFLTREDQPNKEKLLRIRTEQKEKGTS